MKRRILVAGSLNMDLVVEVERHPRPGDTVLGGDVRTFPGGKGANQAVAAARAGGDVVMLGMLGSDGHGRELEESLQRAGVDVRHLAVVPGPSGVAFITVAEGGENMIVVSPGANRQFGPERFDAGLLEGAAMVMMQLEIPLETVAAITRAAWERQVPALLNPAPALALPDALLAQLGLLVVNEGEAELLSGVEVGDPGSAARAAARLRARGAPSVVVTLGGQGVVWASPEGADHLPAFEVEVVDTTAAGDAFCGALAVRLVEGASLEQAVRFASAAGALAATVVGAQPALPARSAIEALVAAAVA